VDRQRDPDIRREARLLIKRLESINALPTSLAVEGLDFEPKGEVDSGSYADVYQREYDGQEVAVKQIRTAESTRYRVIFQQVFSTLGISAQFL
jgi:hypothetical protein